ncbi:MAG: hypothetical protein SWE60_24050 [Thermodesulfobacteriota bacterium]|nr:hypothetical protein [Thermodesulfobacteriota bacterium]
MGICPKNKETRAQGTGQISPFWLQDIHFIAEFSRCLSFDVKGHPTHRLRSELESASLPSNPAIGRSPLAAPLPA